MLVQGCGQPLRNSPGSLAMFTAMRRASSRVSSFGGASGSLIYIKVEHNHAALSSKLEQIIEGGEQMRFPTARAALALVACLVMPAFAQEADQQMRQQVEAVHMKWLEALNKGDVDARAAIAWCPLRLAT
jgi:hypothetical protein